MSTSTQNPILNDPDMKEIVESFLIESKEILESLDVDIIEMEKRPDDTELLNQVFRSFHTIKGSAGFLSLNKLTSITHKGEDILNKLRKKEVALNEEIMDVILVAFDKLKELIFCIEASHTEDVEIEDAHTRLVAVIEKIEKGLMSSNSKQETKKPEKSNIKKTGATKKPAKTKKVSTTKKSSATKSANAKSRRKKSEQKLKEIKKTEIKQEPVKEDVLLIEKEVEKSKETSSKEVQQTPQRTIDPHLSNKDSTIRVDIERLDELLNIASELVLGRNRLTQINSEFTLQFEGTDHARDLSEVVKLIDHMTNELQSIVMKTRMVKIGKVFNRFPRLVRDISRGTNKNVELVIEGEETELDKSLIEEINDPLVHIIRNSVDHGIEKPEDRVAAGKNPTGTIKLSADHEGNNITIIIEDDGKGIDPEVIKEKAVSKGLISAEKAKELNKQEIFNLIFFPGFSTAEVVTNISGRGVGMDVVRTNVTKLRGLINIESEKGAGTKLIIKLPLTLAIILGMIVKVKDESLVIPLSSVIETVRVHSDNINTINGHEVIRLRDNVIPVVDINELLYDHRDKVVDRVWQYIVVVGIAEKRFGIKVDKLIGQKEVVIKSLGNYLGAIKGIAGSTILGDGTVVMILDVAELLTKYTKENAK